MARRLRLPNVMSEFFHAIDVGQRALDYQLARHNVLASNVANIDTPGFRPLDLVRDTENSSAGSVRMTTTQAHHLTARGTAAGDAMSAPQERVIQPGGDGNSVSLEREMAKVGANELRYQVASRIVRQQLSILRYAASDANG